MVLLHLVVFASALSWLKRLKLSAKVARRLYPGDNVVALELAIYISNSATSKYLFS
jgi:hypothetical protein